MVDTSTGEVLEDEPIVLNELDINRKVIFIEKIVKVRRCLTRTRALYRSGGNPLGGSYYRYKKGGIKVPFECVSNKDNKPRVKPEGVHSNHPKSWIYLDNGRSYKGKCNTARYGGTTLNGKSFFQNNEWQNRSVWVIAGANSSLV